MKITRLADGSLDLHEAWPALRIGTLAGAACILGLVLPSCLSGSTCDRRELFGGTVAALVFALVGLLVPDTTFHFDRPRRVLHWSRRRLLRSTDGQVPFAEIRGVSCQASSATDEDGQQARPEYQPTLVTTGGSLPLSASHSLSRSDYAALEQAVDEVLRGSR